MLTDFNVEIQLTILSPPFEANLSSHFSSRPSPAIEVPSQHKARKEMDNRSKKYIGEFFRPYGA